MQSREMRRLRAKKQQTGAETLEKRKQTHPALYVFSIILLVIIVVTFVGSPVASRIGAAASISFGSYDGRPITFQQGNYFSQQEQALAEQLRQSGQELDVGTQLYYIWYQAYLRTITHTAILIEAEKAGLDITSDTVDTALLYYPAFLDSNGKFSESLYTKAGKAEQVQAYKLTRDDLVVQQFSQDVSTGVQTGPQEKAFVLSMAMNQRSFDFVSFPFDSYPAAEIKTYAQEHQADFRKIKVSRILVKGEGEAKEIHQKLTDKTSAFEELAKTYSKDSYASTGGDMGWRYAYDLQGDFDTKDTVNEIFALKAGEISPVIKSSLGYMIYRCDAEAANPDLSDQATIDVVKSYILTHEKGKVEDYFMEVAGKLSRRAGEIGFAAAAKEAAVTVATTDFFPVNLQGVFSMFPVKATPESATPTSAVYSEEFFQRAFSLDKTTASAPIVLDDRIVVLKLAQERTEPPADQAAMEKSFVEGIAQQSLQSDISIQLDNPAKLKDNFDAAYTRNVAPQPRAQ